LPSSLALRPPPAASLPAPRPLLRPPLSPYPPLFRSACHMRKRPDPARRGIVADPFHTLRRRSAGRASSRRREIVDLRPDPRPDCCAPPPPPARSPCPAAGRR